MINDFSYGIMSFIYLKNTKEDLDYWVLNSLLLSRKKLNFWNFKEVITNIHYALFSVFYKRKEKSVYFVIS